MARPVFRIGFDSAPFSQEGGLEGRLEALLRGWEVEWGLDGTGLGLGDRFQNVLEAAHGRSSHRVAVLVDDYDRPLLDAMDDPALQEHDRCLLGAFYSVLKDADEHLCLVFLTGVTRLSEPWLSCDLNQPGDLSLARDYAGMCGITETELTSSFSPELRGLASEPGLDADGCLGALRARYGGHCFHPDGPGEARERTFRCVCNPYGLLHALQERRLGSWWFETATPTFDVCRLREVGLVPGRLADGTLYASKLRLMACRADDPDLVPLLFQAGYLTIRSADAAVGEYTLGVPNDEARYGLVERRLRSWTPGHTAPAAEARTCEGPPR